MTAESSACARCDVDSPESLAAALQQGWTDLCRDDGPGWNDLGICPECQAQERQMPEPGDPEAEQQKRLFGCEFRSGCLAANDDSFSPPDMVERSRRVLRANVSGCAGGCCDRMVKEQSLFWSTRR